MFYLIVKLSPLLLCHVAALSKHYHHKKYAKSKNKHGLQVQVVENNLYYLRPAVVDTPCGRHVTSIRKVYALAHDS